VGRYSVISAHRSEILFQYSLSRHEISFQSPRQTSGSRGLVTSWTQVSEYSETREV